ncbi:MAG: protein jag [Lachnospiraceae bacterium]|nr:protein jag [Lachnospiraceae bacterium]
MDFKEYTGKNLDEALANAQADLSATSDEIEYEVVDKGSTGLLGLGSRPALIKARKNFSIEGTAVDFLKDVFRSMNMEVEIELRYNEIEKEMNIELIGDDMGILIGKRGQTLDSLQYLTSLVVNKATDEHIRVKLDIENYRERREETLVNLAKNIARKVKKNRHEIELEPMSPNERRIIHSTLQKDHYVTTRSEGEEPYRHVVVAPKRDRDERGYRGGRYRDED